MKITNFRDCKKSKDGMLFATVDVTTGFWPFRKTRSVNVFKTAAGYWKFIETGKYTPDSEVESLESAAYAKQQLDTCN